MIDRSIDWDIHSACTPRRFGSAARSKRSPFKPRRPFIFANGRPRREFETRKTPQRRNIETKKEQYGAIIPRAVCLWVGRVFRCRRYEMGLLEGFETGGFIEIVAQNRFCYPRWWYAMKTVGQSNNGNSKMPRKIICDNRKFGMTINLCKCLKLGSMRDKYVSIGKSQFIINIQMLTMKSNIGNRYDAKM